MAVVYAVQFSGQQVRMNFKLHVMFTAAASRVKLS